MPSFLIFAEIFKLHCQYLRYYIGQNVLCSDVKVTLIHISEDVKEKLSWFRPKFSWMNNL